MLSRSNTTTPNSWTYVTRRFKSIQARLALKPSENEDADTKMRGVIASVNRAYRDESCVGYHLLVGSWGKDTAIRPPTDVDVFCFLPDEVFHRFNRRLGNVQSQLLQEVREVLAARYSQTQIRGDGQVVVVGFNSVVIEVVPAFHAQGGGALICDTNDGGRWKHVHPIDEINQLDSTDNAFNGNVRKISRIAKQWKRHCNVPMKSFHIEQLVKEALAKMDWGSQHEFWFDWILRDLFLHMYGRAGGGFYMPGETYEWIDFGDQWQSRALSAYDRACRACEYEYANLNLSAGAEWQKIFGPMIPEQVI